MRLNLAFYCVRTIGNVSMSPYLDYVYYIKWELLLEVCHYGIIYSMNWDLCVSFSKSHQFEDSRMSHLNSFNLEIGVLFRS